MVIHKLWRDGPDCHEGCPGVWSTYHEGMVDGYDMAVQSVIKRVKTLSTVELSTGTYVDLNEVFDELVMIGSVR